ncbi:hypothetical protein [Bellilinea sp.]|jgi:hypothetical protein|uniref:hypothetical protein n=1 Tax=Bellilinea sp. TaxID=2838785 RepID=UPI002ADE1FB8|nr:hypothetical protein [Bellilinea sp.]
MTVLELADMKKSIEELRQQLDGLYRFIDQAELAVQEMEAIAAQAQRTAETVSSFNREMLTLQNRLASVIQPVENAAAVMQRELTHLERIGGQGLAQQPDVTVRAVSSLLQLSLSVAAQFFSMEQLEDFCKPENGYAIDRLRRRWMEWFGELTQYLARALALAQTIAEHDGIGTLAGEYLVALDQLARQCGEWQAFWLKKTVPSMPAADSSALPADVKQPQSEAAKKRKRKTRGKAHDG